MYVLEGIIIVVVVLVCVVCIKGVWYGYFKKGFVYVIDRIGISESS